MAKEDNIEIHRKHGMKEGRWAILDLGNVVVHILDTDTREFYGIEYLWQEATTIPWP